MNKFIISARPKQTLKNSVVFIPLIFTLEEWLPNAILSSLVSSFFCFLAFSCCSIIGYQINDWIDKEYDKKHPAKKLRPIANNQISLKEFYIYILLLLAFGLIFSISVNFYVLYMFFTYLALSVLYSLKLKRIILIDSISVTIFYIIRMIAGAYSITLNISLWLYILTFFSTLFLIIIKRTSETNKGNFRDDKIVIFYNNLANIKIKSFLLTINIILYLTYAISEIISDQRNLIFIITIIFFSSGIIRYFSITNGNTRGESPETIITKDFFIQLSVLLYLISIFFS
ncbi:MAG: hypothetical protein CL772_04950 [Chloroflexi bacterium]|nr:hypothetical protein [Chloroflexota bacterium]|tara:strand:+ start:13734 stop:14591 length:858 start_codon:yes stop_codon:yes gene_type:complete